VGVHYAFSTVGTALWTSIVPPKSRPILKERFSSKYRLIIKGIIMSTKRKTHNARFKAKVALEAYKGDKTAAELISAHKVSSGQISTWKKC